MFRPAIQKLNVLVLIALFCSLMVYISFNSIRDYRKPFYDTKVIASNLMFKALKSLRQDYLDQGKTFSSLDPLETGLVFYQDDLPGNPSSKLTTLNPNFAAYIVELMIDAGIQIPEKRDRKPSVAIAFSSSFPGANIAVLSACLAMDMKPVIITSLSGSNYGAIDYDEFSWLDMERILIDKNIFPLQYLSKSVSIGKGSDYGIGLDFSSFNEINKAVKKHDIDFLYNKKETDLLYYINERMRIYDVKNDFAPYDLFINVGGGHASIGTLEQVRSSSGFLTSDYLSNIYEKNYDDCLLYRFSQSPNYNTAAINIIDIKNLINDKLPMIKLSDNDLKIDWNSDEWVSDDENNQLWRSKYNKSGILFIERKYNFWIVIPCLFISILVVLSVGLHSHFQIKKRMTLYE